MFMARLFFSEFFQAMQSKLILRIISLVKLSQGCTSRIIFKTYQSNLEKTEAR